jgi:hypothetical protein
MKINEEEMLFPCVDHACTVGVFIQKIKEQNMAIYKIFVVGRFSFLALDGHCLIQRLMRFPY